MAVDWSGCRFGMRPTSIGWSDGCRCGRFRARRMARPSGARPAIVDEIARPLCGSHAGMGPLACPPVGTRTLLSPDQAPTAARRRVAGPHRGHRGAAVSNLHLPGESISSGGSPVADATRWRGRRPAEALRLFRV